MPHRQRAKVSGQANDPLRALSAPWPPWQQGLPAAAACCARRRLEGMAGHAGRAGGFGCDLGGHTLKEVAALELLLGLADEVGVLALLHPEHRHAEHTGGKRQQRCDWIQSIGTDWGGRVQLWGCGP